MEELKGMAKFLKLQQLNPKMIERLHVGENDVDNYPSCFLVIIHYKDENKESHTRAISNNVTAECLKNEYAIATVFDIFVDRLERHIKEVGGTPLKLT